MKIKRTHLIVLIGLLLAISTACSFSASTAKVTEAFTAQDVNGEPEATTTFSQDEVFYLLVTVANAPDDTVTKAVWYVVDAEGADPNSELYQAKYEGGGKITFDLSNDNLWPVGTYKVELYLNDKLDRTLEFSVEGSATAAGNSGAISVVDAYTARFENDTPEKTAVFSQNEEFSLVVELSEAQSDTVVKAVWVAVNIEGNDPNTIINETESTGESLITFSLSHPDPWPLGEYTVEVHLDGVYQGQVDFSVE
jgi:hypothetical protein